MKVKALTNREPSSVILTGKRMRLSSISVHPSILRGSMFPVLRGLESLTNVMGNKRMFLGYIGSSDMEAIGRDWRQVGIDIKKTTRPNSNNL